MQKHTSIRGVYVALEDFVEKSPQNAPIFSTPASADESPLRNYIALQETYWSLLGPRRVPAIPCPAQNTSTAISISTSVGFRQLELDQYIKSVAKLQPDIAFGFADIITAEKASVKRIEKSVDRTHDWLRASLRQLEYDETPPTAFFAPIPPVDKEQQTFFLSDLVEEFQHQINGLSISHSSSVNAIPSELSRLPRFGLIDPTSPHDILTAVALGVDVITLPFVTAASEQGVALTFSFPAECQASNQPLGFDLWSNDHTVDISPLTPGCECYTCKRHHRAYIHHLLQAKEMLAWTLLQIHNFTMMDKLFQNVRDAISKGTFEEDVKLFNQTYEPTLPAMTGEGPRIRGYQMKSVGGDPKANPKAYGRLDDAAQKLAEAESGIATPTGGAVELQEHGFADKVD